MGKRICFVLGILMIGLLVGCGKKEAKSISFEAQYIRTDGIVEDVEYPVVTKITSVEELNDYYHKQLDYYNFSDNTETSVSFTTAIDQYDESYFEKSFLLICLVEENSGSIYHTVKSVREDGKVEIEKLMPDDGSTDIATWHILIEMDQKYKDIDFDITFDEVSKS